MHLYSFEMIDSTFSFKIEGEVEAFSFEEANEELQKVYKEKFRKNHTVCILKEIVLTDQEILEYKYLDSL